MGLWIQTLNDTLRRAPAEHADMLKQDVSYGLRFLVKDARFTAVAILALALGIGANTAMFTFLDSIVIRPLPFPHSERLVMAGYSYHELSPANFLDYRDRNQVFEEMAAIQYWNANLTGMATPERLQGYLVSANFFQLMGVKAEIGRSFLPEEEEPGKDLVAVVSYGLWKKEFGSDPGIVGRTVELNGRPRTVIGVLPRGFQFSGPADVWAPLPFDADTRKLRRPQYLLSVARMKAGITFEQAQADLSRIAQWLADTYPEANAGRTIAVVSLHDLLAAPMRPALLILMAAVVFVLLIACANVANLLLSRATIRQRELSIRAGLGARRSRIIRQLLTESVLLSLLGGLLGVAGAYWGIRLLAASAPDGVAQTFGSIGLDRRVLGFTLAVSVATGLGFGILPALNMSGRRLCESLKESGRGTAGSARSRRVGNVLVAAEIALSLVLLIGSGLMIRSFGALLKVNPGFKPDNVLSLQVALPGRKYNTNPKMISFYDQVLDRLEALPGVLGAGLTSNLPLAATDQSDSYLPEGDTAARPGEAREVHVRTVSPGYFATMGIAMERGRTFSKQDTATAPRVAIVDESAARLYWGDEDPIGKRLKEDVARTSPEPPWITIVGLVQDVHHQNLSIAPEPQIYLPYTQTVDSGTFFIIHSASDPQSVAASVRAEIASVDHDQPVYGVKTMDKILQDSLVINRFSMELLVVFAAMALILAAIGIYGVVSYGVTQRTHEIGVRMALGARPRQVLSQVVKQALLLAVIGETAGAAAAFGVTRAMSGLLFGVGSSDPLTFIGLAGLLLAVVYGATYFPARKATRIDPLSSLRYE